MNTLAQNRTLRGKLGTPPALPLLLAATCLLFAMIEPKFIRFENIMNILRNTSYLSVIAAGQMLVIVVGGFDISVGAVIALTSVISTLSIVHFLDVLPDFTITSIVFGCVAGMLIAGLIGLANGVCVAILRAPPFIVTIGTMSIAVGLAEYLSGGTPLYGLPEIFTDTIGRGRIHGVPIVLLIAAVIVTILGYVLTSTRTGRCFYAVGGNERGAHFSGVNVPLHIILAYGLSSLLASATGLLLTARVGSGEATLGSSMMLDSIAAAILAGVSLKGGSGRLSMVILGASFLSVIANGMNLIRVDSRYQVILVGTIVIAAAALDNFKRLRSTNL
ncbi:ribose transport system permease protein [Rhizobium leguminosarum]|nr:ribose transport system permease protein [Rhizobium leguminosarum]